MCHYLWIDNLLDYTFHNAQDTRQGEVMELSANHKRKNHLLEIENLFIVIKVYVIHNYYIR